MKKGGLENLEIYKLAERLEVFIHKVTDKFPTELIKGINGYIRFLKNKQN